MKKLLKYKIHSIVQNLYYTFLFILGFGLFIFVFTYRIQFVEFFNFNLFAVLLSYIFYPLYFLAIFLAIIPIKALKKKILNKFGHYREPSYIEKYGIDYKEPKIEDFNLTKEEFNKHINIPKIDLEIVTLILVLIFVLYMLINHKTYLSELLYLVSGFILLVISIRFLIKRINSNLYIRNFPNRKAEEYLEALEIHNKIQQEKRDLLERKINDDFL